MIIEKILKQLTPERIEKEIKAIQRVKLPPELQKWVREYEKVGDRDEFFWKWLYKANQAILFPGVEKKYQKSLGEVKIIFNMFLSLLDDTADKTLNKNLLNELIKIPFESDYIKFNQLAKEEKKYLKFGKKLWRYINTKIRKYPRYKEMKEIFGYDVAQLLNSMKYSYLINKNHFLINETECWIYLSHNMQAMIDLTLDLMCFPKFDFKKLGIFREIAWEAQKMARVGNWISTWEREIHENDFTGGIWAYVIEKGIIFPEELHQFQNRLAIIKKVKKSNAENYFLKNWEKSYRKIEKLGIKFSKSSNVKLFLIGLETLIFMHLSSRGKK